MKRSEQHKGVFEYREQLIPHVEATTVQTEVNRGVHTSVSLAVGKSCRNRIA